MHRRIGEFPADALRAHQRHSVRRVNKRGHLRRERGKRRARAKHRLARQRQVWLECPLLGRKARRRKSLRQLSMQIVQRTRRGNFPLEYVAAVAPKLPEPADRHIECRRAAFVHRRGNPLHIRGRHLAEKPKRQMIVLPQRKISPRAGSAQNRRALHKRGLFFF